MFLAQKNDLYYSQNYSQKMIGKLSYKIKIKDDYIRADKTSALYVQVFLNKKKKIFPLHIFIPVKHFDKLKQRVNSKNEFHKDYNLIIEKFLADLNTIELNYRLSGIPLDIEKLSNEINNPTSFIDFVMFWEEELLRQKDLIKPGTYRQQTTALNKLKEFKSSILFHEITHDFINELAKYFKIQKKNQPNTVASLLKNIKKYMHCAEKRGIKLPISYENIKSPRFKGNRAFLMPDEINKLYEYWDSKFVNETHKNILSRFLFSCFTGLRISDIQNINQDNIVGDFLVFTTQKTTKLQHIQLNKTARKFINERGAIFNSNYTGEYINRTLKDIAKICGIKKRVSFHVARHTFATNFLISGGRVEVLQKILGHSKIDETMIYVHIAESVTNVQIFNMDNIIID